MAGHNNSEEKMNREENNPEDQLSGLGVSVYDQQDLEEDIMKQFDEEATRQAIEQQKKFAEKELTKIQQGIRNMKSVVTSLSQQIQILLGRPISEVILQVKQLKELQQEKKEKLKELQEREKHLKDKIANNDFSDVQSLQVDRLFDLPSSSDQIDQLKQIRAGLITPFSNKFGNSSLDDHTTTNKKEEPHPTVSLADFDWLGINSDTGKGKSPANKKSASKPKAKLSPSLSPSSSAQTNEQLDAVSLLTDNTSSSKSDKDKDKSIERDSSSDAESYLTDDELGRKRKRYFSGEESDEELIHVNWKKRSSRKVKRRKNTGTVDDGDEQLYKERIKKYKSNMEDEMSYTNVEDGFKVPTNIWEKLYRYQQTGIRWLWELHCQQAGGIMGDEMGLGKTIQMIGFLAGLKVSNIRSHVTRELGLGPVLIVCPATVLHQWVREFHTWYPPFRVAILHDMGSYDGTKTSLLNKMVHANSVIVTTYASLRINHELLLKYQWEYIVLDEGHKIRNPDAEITLACKQFATPHRIILSGSPVQNNLRELWSLFDFAFPGKLGTLPVFMEQFSVPITLGGYVNASQTQVETAYRCACILRDTINPYLLRRLKSDVKIQLPNKNEQVLFCRLSDYQRELYEDYIKGPEVESMMRGGKLIFQGLIMLRKLCNHPDLVTKEYQRERLREANGEQTDDEEDEEMNDFTLLSCKKRKRLEANEEGDYKGAFDHEEESYGFWRRSGKMIVIEALLKMWYTQKHKVLLFTQSRQMLAIMEKFLNSQGYSYVTMDGTTSIKLRQSLIKNFNEDPSIFLFLLTTRVGGLGVNLTGADRVVIYDPDWNPSTDTQARERAWRIGQTRPVTIYRLITSGTIEEKIYHRQIFKQFLTNRVLRDPRQRRFFKSNNLYELFMLGPSDGRNKTETSAILAGTGSEIKIPSRKKRKRNSSSLRSLYKSHENELEGCHDTEQMNNTTINEQDKTTSNDHEIDSNLPSTSGLDQNTVKEEKRIGNSDVTEEKMELMLSSNHQRKSKKKKKKKRKRQRDMEVDGHCINGLDDIDIYNPGSEDEENTTANRQDNLILRKLFNKSGVQTAIQYDTVITGGDPDSVIVESEANKIAQSAAKALKESSRYCQESRGSNQWGQPTWTGTHGTVGLPRFGQPSKETKSSESHFSGTSTNTSGGSLTLSSNVLLNKMRSRNALSLPAESTLKHLHSNENQELLRELRSFIANRTKKPGQATTEEILNKFSSRLAPTDSPLFRSMLHEICDFHRSHGDGIWTLKGEYR